MKTTLLSALTLSLLMLIGCGQAGGGSGGVAVIDLDRIAKAIGKDKVIEESLRNYDGELRGQLNQLQTQMQTQLQQTQQTFGAKPTEAQQQQLQGLVNEANQRMQTGIQTANQRLNERRAQLVNEFRDQVIPVAKGVASSRGLGTVLVSNPMILVTGPDHDITDAVISKMTAQGGTAAPAAPAATPAPASTAEPAQR